VEIDQLRSPGRGKGLGQGVRGGGKQRKGSLQNCQVDAQRLQSFGARSYIDFEWKPETNETDLLV
jgi:hypothetical protein